MTLVHLCHLKHTLLANTTKDNCFSPLPPRREPKKKGWSLTIKSWRILKMNFNGHWGNDPQNRLILIFRPLQLLYLVWFAVLIFFSFHYFLFSRKAMGLLKFVSVEHVYLQLPRYRMQQPLTGGKWLNQDEDLLGWELINSLIPPVESFCANKVTNWNSVFKTCFIAVSEQFAEIVHTSSQLPVKHRPPSLNSLGQTLFIVESTHTKYQWTHQVLQRVETKDNLPGSNCVWLL